MYPGGPPTVMLPCRHRFHRHCLAKHFDYNGRQDEHRAETIASCPMCRVEFDWNNLNDQEHADGIEGVYFVFLQVRKIIAFVEHISKSMSK